MERFRIIASLISALLFCATASACSVIFESNGEPQQSVAEACSEAEQRQLPELECQALVDLHISTIGDGWDFDQYWLTTEMGPCDWFGIDCNDGHVVEIDLVGNGLDGELSTTLGNLTFLKRLLVDKNNIGGTIPDGLGTITTLTTIELDENVITGPIPSNFAGLVNLTRLDLETNMLSGPLPTYFENFPKLQILDLQRNDFTGTIPTGWTNLPNLRRIRLDENELQGGIPSELGELTGLIELRLNNNYLNGSIPETLGPLLALETLHLQANCLAGKIPDDIGPTPLGLPLLGEVFLNGNACLEILPANILHTTWLDAMDPDWADGCPDSLGTCAAL